jgi:hypothetical protein
VLECRETRRPVIKIYYNELCSYEKSRTWSAQLGQPDMHVSYNNPLGRNFRQIVLNILMLTLIILKFNNIQNIKFI